MRIALYGRPAASEVSPYIKALFDELNKYKVEVWVYAGFYESIKLAAGKTHVHLFETHTQLKNKIDCMLSIGGDGTLLETLVLVRDSGIPILGINTGRLGFLASVSKEEIPQALEALLNKKYTIDCRTLLKLKAPGNLFGDISFAMNEVTIHKKDAAAMMSVKAYINDEFLATYWADGLIVATPTGSTAYSLSCGGPIMIPDSKSLIITPIAPHNLNVRPLVVSDQDTIRLKVEARSANYQVSLDSRSALVDGAVELEIKKETFGINLIRLENQSFMSTLRAKLMWGQDKRN